MYESLRVDVKVERVQFFAFTHNLSYIASISFTQAKITRHWKSTLIYTKHYIN